MHWKPEGYTSVSPYLIVSDAQATLNFAQAVFDAECLRLHHREDGGIKHAEFRIDDTVVMVGEMSGGATAHIHVYVPDADAAFALALATGGNAVQEMTRAGDGDYRGGVADANGTVWWISQQEEYRE
ncbi:VOC family protein [Sulfitobacter mediterraneus]|jgi:PhnB protein|uniref:VOC family protein n=1 Tax=Sulfitobacter mediterraneus TaxID=83219 RepID=UPI001931A6ED|nr:VOC family protein [Sulfitobacter mediterraneus]MBM1633165.1 VOC family protein [Sulfitobacter mediterraneus]MBM1640701.1 VOC family protein [Sulfitobacter mediterraneus]MBM1645030.1 VOC family protein [Sulfitobacter mediterraneus]MBM1648821.1 VOC family protein [Sulfitobacter mediterraneus]MBM1652842.1 VOC family protein [Sulfitobacter mediterraneus]